MKKRRIALPLALLAFSLLIAPIAARAATDFGLQFSTQSGALTRTFCDNDMDFAGCTHNGTDSDPTFGVIGYNTMVGNWTIDKGNGFGPPFEIQPLLLDLSSFDATTTNGHLFNALDIKLTVIGLTGPLGNLNFFNEAGGTSSLGGTVYTSQGWLDPTNHAFCGTGCATSIPITSLLKFTGTNFSGGASGSGSTGAGPYSITLEITIDANGPDQTSFDSQLELTSIPEPATLSVLGAGLLALGTGLRRRLLRA